VAINTSNLVNKLIAAAASSGMSNNPWSGHANHLNFGGDQPYLWNYKNKNWLQFLFIVKAAVLKQQISKFYP